MKDLSNWTDQGVSRPAWEELEVKIGTLEKSRAIWNETWSSSAEAKRASVVLSIMLKKVHSKIAVSKQSLFVNSSGSNEVFREDNMAKLSLNRTYPKSSFHCIQLIMVKTAPLTVLSSAQPESTREIVTTESTPSSGYSMPAGLELMPEDTEPLGTLFDVPADFDWVCSIFLLLTCGLPFAQHFRDLDLRADSIQDMFDSRVRPQVIPDQNWADFMQNIDDENDYYNI